MIKTPLTEEQKEFMLCRGPVTELELVEWELDGLSPSQRMSLEKQRLFLRAFATRGIVLDGCRAAGVSRTSVMYWRDQSEWFELLFQAALDEAADRIEGEAFRRAVEGYQEPVIYQGMITMVENAETGEKSMLTVTKYSDALMQTLLKGARPEKYRDNHKVEVSGNGGGVLVVPGVIDPAEWAKQAAAQQAKYAGNTGQEE